MSKMVLAGSAWGCFSFTSLLMVSNGVEAFRFQNPEDYMGRHIVLAEAVRDSGHFVL